VIHYDVVDVIPLHLIHWYLLIFVTDYLYDCIRHCCYCPIPYCAPIVGVFHIKYLFSDIPICPTIHWWYCYSFHLLTVISIQTWWLIYWQWWLTVDQLRYWWLLTDPDYWQYWWWALFVDVVIWPAWKWLIFVDPHSRYCCDGAPFPFTFNWPIDIDVWWWRVVQWWWCILVIYSSVLTLTYPVVDSMTPVGPADDPGHCDSADVMISRPMTIFDNDIDNDDDDNVGDLTIYVITFPLLTRSFDTISPICPDGDIPIHCGDRCCPRSRWYSIAFDYSLTDYLMPPTMTRCCIWRPIQFVVFIVDVIVLRPIFEEEEWWPRCWYCWCWPWYLLLWLLSNWHCRDWRWPAIPLLTDPVYCVSISPFHLWPGDRYLCRWHCCDDPGRRIQTGWWPVTHYQAKPTVIVKCPIYWRYRYCVDVIGIGHSVVVTGVWAVFWRWKAISSRCCRWWWTPGGGIWWYSVLVMIW